MWIDTIVSKVNSDFVIHGTDAEAYKKALMNDKGEFIYARTIRDAISELNVVGEAFPYNIIDDSDASLEIVLQNPDFIVVNKDTVDHDEVIHLRADDELKKIATSTKKKDIKIRKSIDPTIIELVKANKTIPLPSTYVSHLALMENPYNIRGTSRLCRHFKNLIIDDRLKDLAYEQGIDYIVSKQLVDGLYNEAMAPSFCEGLNRQRRIMEEFIVNKILKPYGRIHSLNTEDVSISWNKPIDCSIGFEFLSKAREESK